MKRTARFYIDVSIDHADFLPRHMEDAGITDFSIKHNLVHIPHDHMQHGIFTSQDLPFAVKEINRYLRNTNAPERLPEEDGPENQDGTAGTRHQQSTLVRRLRPQGALGRYRRSPALRQHPSGRRRPATCDAAQNQTAVPATPTSPAGPNRPPTVRPNMPGARLQPQPLPPPSRHIPLGPLVLQRGVGGVKWATYDQAFHGGECRTGKDGGIANCNRHFIPDHIRVIYRAQREAALSGIPPVPGP